MGDSEPRPATARLAPRDRRWYALHVFSRDTEAAAHQAQVAAARRLGPEGRLRVAAQMSEDARAIAFEGMCRRHPEYTPEQARRVVLRALWGEPLATRVWGEAATR